MSPYDWAWLLVGMTLQCMVLSTMLKGSLRRYPFIFAYLVVSFLVTVVEISFRHYFGPRSQEFSRAYWTGDFLGTFLVLMIIIHLIRTAMENHKYRGSVYGGLLLGAVTTGLVTLVLMNPYSRGFRSGAFLTELGRDYYFSAVILNVILWITLVRVNHGNRQLFLITSGLGLKLTGAAIAHALRLTMATHLWFVANHFLMLTYLANLGIWYFALKRLPLEIPVSEENAAETSPRGIEPASLKAPRL